MLRRHTWVIPASALALVAHGGNCYRKTRSIAKRNPHSYEQKDGGVFVLEHSYSHPELPEHEITLFPYPNRARKEFYLSSSEYLGGKDFIIYPGRIAQRRDGMTHRSVASVYPGIASEILEKEYHSWWYRDIFTGERPTGIWKYHHQGVILLRKLCNVLPVLGDATKVSSIDSLRRGVRGISATKVFRESQKRCSIVWSPTETAQAAEVLESLGWRRKEDGTVRWPLASEPNLVLNAFLRPFLAIPNLLFVTVTLGGLKFKDQVELPKEGVLGFEDMAPPGTPLVDRRNITSPINWELGKLE